MLHQVKEYKDEKVEENKDKQTPDSIFSDQFQLVADEKEGIFRIDYRNNPYEEYKRYLVFNLAANLIKRIENNTQIRMYRKKDIEDLVELLNNHTPPSISSLKEKIQKKLSVSPGLLKQFKRLFHGFPGDEQLTDRILSASEEGEYKDMQDAMRHLNINLNHIPQLSKKIFESIPHRNKLSRALLPKSKVLGKDIVNAKRYLIFTFFNFAIQQIKNKNDIHENVKNCLKKILDMLYNNFHPSIKDYNLNSMIELEINSTNKAIDQSLANIADDKLRVADEEEEQELINKERQLIKFKKDLPNILLPLDNLIKAALENAEDRDIQSAMRILGFEFEKKGKLFNFLKIKFDVIDLDLRKNPETPLKHLEWCRKFPTVSIHQETKEPILEEVINFKGTQNGASCSPFQ